ncbi:MAG TPA: hypothetical protein ENK52_03715, partial [Saprospiraceae bacterium]|nr:hypothetical protein [Saprospiraceae bacterium]
MNTKLTLSLNKNVIMQAKIYAKKNNVSLSFIIENYLLKIISEFQGEHDVKGSIVDELSGIINLDNGNY